MEFTSALPLIFLVYISLFYIVMTVSRVFLLMMDLKIKPDSVDEEIESKKTQQTFSKLVESLLSLRIIIIWEVDRCENLNTGPHLMDSWKFNFKVYN